MGCGASKKQEEQTQDRDQAKAVANNNALVFVKPHANNDAVNALVKEKLAAGNFKILAEGSVTGEKIDSDKIIDKHYATLARYAVEVGADELPVPEETQKKFQEQFGTAWSELIAAGSILNAKEAAAKLGDISATDLSAKWKSNDNRMKLAPGLYVTKFESDSIYVINGFYLVNREKFTKPGSAVNWYTIEWAEDAMPWADFRAKFIGPTNPNDAPAESLRGIIFKDWEKLGLSEVPNVSDNGVHASAGPIEGLNERGIWTGSTIESDPYGKVLIEAGCDMDLVKEWLANPMAEVNGKNQPVYDHLEDQQSTDVTAIIKGFKKGGAEAETEKKEETGGGDAAAAGVGASTGDEGERNKNFRIIHFNDVYNVSAADRGDICGGAARYTALINSYLPGGSRYVDEETTPTPLVLFSGDLFAPSVASTVTLGAHMPAVINTMHVAASVYGNHDFDFGVDQLEKLRDQCNFPWLISNVIDVNTGKSLADGHVTLTLQHKGVKIGLVGIVEQAWMETLATINQDDIKFEDPTLCAQRLSKKLREEDGVDMVIALTHMRIPNDLKLAQEAGDCLDLILGGHDHHYEVVKTEPFGTLLFKSGTDFRDMSVIDLELASEKGKPFALRGSEHIQVTRDMPEDKQVVEITSELEQEIQRNMSNSIGRLAVPLDVRFKAIRTSETNAANFVADCVRGQVLPHPDVVLINSGTLRTDAVVPKGEYTVGDLMNMLPMMDPLVVIKLTGKQLVEALENGVSQWPALEGRWPCVSGISFQFDPANPPGQRVVRDSVQLGGQLLQEDKRPVVDGETYTLCTKEYLATGKDGYSVFADCERVGDAENYPMLAVAVRQNFMARRVLDSFRSLEGHTARGAVRRLKELRFIRKHKDESGSPTSSPDGKDAAGVHTTIENRIVRLSGESVCDPLA